tara:strand:+ start:409 stop:1656 length:1248 start_codon:yes stop_codon:yes gene_type:complete
MNLSKSYSNNILIYLFFYFTLIIGFLFNEESAGGAKYDYNYHLGIVDFFLSDTINALKNYSDVVAYHSPIFYVFLKYILYFGDLIGRFIFLNISSIAPIIIYLCINEKFKIKNFSFLYLSCFIMLSPYYRSTAIWPGDENLALLFFILSILFYYKFLNTDNINHKITFIILNVISLAVSAYFRPNYSFFSIFYFYEFVIRNFQFKYFFAYILTSFFLAFPAFYYVFIMKIYFFSSPLSDFNPLRSFSLTYTIFLFYLVPFIFVNFNKKNYFLKLNYLNLFFTIIFTIIFFYYFKYEHSTGGGIFYMIQKNFFDSNFFMSLIFAISFYFSNILLEINKTKNIILIIILLFFELDFYFYMETFDPLFLLCLLLLFDAKIINNFFNLSLIRNTNTLMCYLLIFYIAKIANLHFFLNKL